MTESDDRPLEGLKVVEISLYLQGPMAGLILAGLGADVVKIEPVGRPDPFRSFVGMFGVNLDEKGQDWIFAAANRGKRCVAIDITTERGRPIFEKLIGEADVFVSNLMAGSLEQLGADADTLMELNPNLVYARGAGFGFRGPLAADPCQDTVGMAYSGFMDIASTTEAPHYPPGALSDVATGTNLASAILAGLTKRSITGKGCVVGTSQVQTMMWLASMGIGFAANLGTRMTRFDLENPSSPLLSIYETADGWISIGAVLDEQWVLIANTLGLEHWLADERTATLVGLIEHADLVSPELVARFRTESTDYWWKLLREAGIWVSPVNRLDELADDEHIRANDYIVTFPDGSVGGAVPFEVDGFTGVRGVGAAYGEHTDEVLAELGYDQDSIIDLKIDNSVW